MADVNGIDGDRLITFIERIERLEEEKKGIADDIKDIYAEAKATGFETKYIKRIVALRKIEPEKRQMEEAEFEVYKQAVGII